MSVTPLRLATGMLAVMLLAAACARTPPDGEWTAGSAGQDLGGGMAVGGPELETEELESPEARGTVPDRDRDREQPQATGDPSLPEAGEAAPQADEAEEGGNGGSDTREPVEGDHFGVDGRTVNVVYSTQLEDCGDDPSTAGQGTASDKGLRVLDEWVSWFNEEVLANETDWQIDYEVVDDGGSFCPEKARATALEITEDLRPFAVLSDLVQPAEGPVVADAVTRAGIVHIGPSWSLADSIQDRAPYAWPVFPVDEQLFRNLAAWMETHIRGTEAEGGAVGGVGGERSYGVLAVDSPMGRELGGAVQDLMRQHGMDPDGLYLISGDPGVAAQQATNTALTMRQDGINSLVLAVPYPSAINSTMVLSEAMNAQNYLPDIFVGNYGLSLFDSLHNDRVWENVQGTSAQIPLVLRWAVAADSEGNLSTVDEFDEIPENESGYIEVWKQQLGHNDEPQDGSQPQAYTTWGQLSMLVTGLLHLEEGQPLTPQTWGEAVHSARRGGPNRCTIGRFMVRDYEYTSGFDWEIGNSGLRARSTSVYWVNEQTPMGSRGYYESYDNYRFFRQDQWPAEHTHDTGEEGVDIPKQERIGIRPWTPCTEFPNYPDG